MLAERVAETGCAIVYVNQVGGQDELVFDGASLVIGADGHGGGLGRPVRRGGAAWSTSDVRRSPRPDASATAPPAADGGGEHRVPPGRRRARPGRRWPPVLDPEAEVYEALVLGTRDYLAKNGFTDAVIGLSGGIDSSLVAAVAVDALGPGPRARGDHAVAVLERGLGGRRGDPGRQPGHRPRHRAHRGGPPGPGRRARPRCSAASPPG